MLELLERAQRTIDELRVAVVSLKSDNQAKSDLIVLMQSVIKKEKVKILEHAKKCRYCVHGSYSPHINQHHCELYGSKYYDVDPDFCCKAQAVLIPEWVSEIVFGEEKEENKS